MTDIYLQHLWNRQSDWPRGTRFWYRFYTLEKVGEALWEVRDRAGESVHLCPVTSDVYDDPEDLEAELDRVIDDPVG